MANSTNMALALAEVFDLARTTAESISRALKLAGLRADGGKGRGATSMSASDTFNVAVAYASGLGMTTAPAFVRSVIDMKLTDAVHYHGDTSTVWLPSSIHPKSTLLGMLTQDPLPGVRIESTFGPFISGWIEGLYDEALPWKREGTLKLVIGHKGPTADLEMAWGENRLEIGFAAPGVDFYQNRDWERQIVMRGGLFRKLVDIIEA